MHDQTRIMVVEDDPTIASLIEFVLRGAGYQALLATTASDALALIEASCIDLVILDWMLPDIPGVQICTDLKERSGRRFLPILMLTARGEVSDRIRALDSGADDYLTKPF
ncbi:MAG: response regulator, partial [Roseiflexaceae bacterium]|nr:response regulator [Roseiflexaceae bacterium]